MGSIILLAFGACFFPTLLACVAIMISRPEPRWLLIAFYAGGLLASVSTGIVVLAVFDNGEAVLGSTRSDPHPAMSIIAGVVAGVVEDRVPRRGGHQFARSVLPARARQDLKRRLQHTPAGRARSPHQRDYVSLLEVPLVGYLVRPESTAKRVTAMSRRLNAKGLRITGWLVGLLGASLLMQGVAALAG